MKTDCRAEMADIFNRLNFENQREALAYAQVARAVEKSRSITQPPEPDNFKEYMSRNRNPVTFSVLLERLRKEKNLSPSGLYKKAWIDRRFYSKIMGERGYHPSKNTALAFGLALNLSLPEMSALLESAGYILSRSIPADVVVMFCIENKIFRLYEVNDLLIRANQPPLAVR